MKTNEFAGSVSDRKVLNGSVTVSFPRKTPVIGDVHPYMNFSTGKTRFPCNCNRKFREFCVFDF